MSVHTERDPGDQHAPADQHEPGDQPSPADRGEPVDRDHVQVVRDYVRAVFWRGREPLEPPGFTPNYADQPSRHKVYLEVPRIALSADLPADLGAAGDVLLGDAPRDDAAPGNGLRDGTGATAMPEKGWDITSLSTFLRLSYGVLDRRLRVGWNQDSHARAHLEDALWGRGTASGGGMYPLEIYWLPGPGADPLPGVYHYSTAHHAFERLLTGDVTDQVRGALADGTEADGYLLVSVRFWKNAFKYNNFCYHVVTQDLGALLGSWEALAHAMNRPLRRLLWFDDEALNRLLGLDTSTETVLAAVPLCWSCTARYPAPGARAGARVGEHPVYERSRVTFGFERVEAVHRAVLDGTRPLPDPGVARSVSPAATAGGASEGLPPPASGRLKVDLGQVFRSRRSSFGSFVGRPRLTREELGTLLAASANARRYRSDVKPADVPLTSLYVLANRVDGLGPGTYRYEPDGHRLAVIEHRDLDRFLQRNYYLTNYNLEQVGAVVAISARWEPALAAYGTRGYRVVNAEVGAVAQAGYLAATGLGIGCGAVLGFDNIAIDEALGLADGDDRTFLYLLLGHERADRAEFDDRLVRQTAAGPSGGGARP